MMQMVCQLSAEPAHQPAKHNYTSSEGMSLAARNILLRAKDPNKPNKTVSSGIKQAMFGQRSRETCNQNEFKIVNHQRQPKAPNH
mmetsp:Transcript_37864/g.87655  ORF Transcript_37864/g.87655 Transcript_37864/m.87655 type:complete len:85 (+) Transcript_37864:256-510(+)